MAKRATGRRGHVRGKAPAKRTQKRKSSQSLSAGVPIDFERVEQVTERQVMEHGPMTRGMDARFLSLPALNIISLLVFAVLAAYQVTTFKYDVQTRMDELGKQVTTLTNRIDEMNVMTDAKAQRRWSRLDMKMWCKDTEDTNRDPSSGKKNFTCGAIGPTSLDAAP